MDKAKLIKQFEAQIADALQVLTQAAVAAHEAATHSESKAEDQYDTRGLEASYLAGAQSKRAMELEELLAIYRYADLKTFGPTTPIASTAVVELRSEAKTSHYLLMPKGGGMSVVSDGVTIQTVTPQAPLGAALLGRVVGDDVDVEIQRKVRNFEIVSVA